MRFEVEPSCYIKNSEARYISLKVMTIKLFVKIKDAFGAHVDFFTTLFKSEEREKVISLLFNRYCMHV